MNLKDNLKKIRKDNNLSQEDLAEKLGVSRQSVSKWEQGIAYPEMDKVLQMCKMFNLNIDEFLNQDIKEVEKNKESKLNINKYIEEFLAFVTKTVKLFASMSFKDKCKCIFEQIFIVICLMIVSGIIRSLLGLVLSNIIDFLPYEVYSAVTHIFRGIYYFIFIILGAVLLIHVFKIRYLDYYEIVDEVKEENEETEEQVESENKEFKREDKKVIIRDPNDSGFGFIKGIIKVIVVCFKAILLFVGVNFCFTLIAACVALALSFMLIKTGLLFIGSFLLILACITINILILYAICYFIVNKKINLAFLFITFIISLILIGISGGLIVISIKDFKIVDDIDPDYMETKEVSYDMTDNLLILNNYSYDVEYIESDNNDVKVVYEYSKVCGVEPTKGEDVVEARINCNDFDSFKQVIKNFKEKKIFNAVLLRVKVYTNSKNIEALKNNEEKYYLDINRDSYMDEIDRLNDELELKNEEIENLKERLEE